jgi:hypothetical protein
MSFHIIAVIASRKDVMFGLALTNLPFALFRNVNKSGACKELCACACMAHSCLPWACGFVAEHVNSMFLLGCVGVQ